MWCFLSAPVAALHLAFKAQQMHRSAVQPPLSVVMQLCSLASDSLKTCEQTMSSEDTLHQVSWCDKYHCSVTVDSVNFSLPILTYFSLGSCWRVTGCCVCAILYGSLAVVVLWDLVCVKNILPDSFAPDMLKMWICWLIW